MDSSQEFPHVAFSPGEGSPETEEINQGQTAEESQTSSRMSLPITGQESFEREDSEGSAIQTEKQTPGNISEVGEVSAEQDSGTVVEADTQKTDPKTEQPQEVSKQENSAECTIQEKVEESTHAESRPDILPESNKEEGDREESIGSEPRQSHDETNEDDVVSRPIVTMAENMEDRETVAEEAKESCEALGHGEGESCKNIGVEVEREQLEKSDGDQVNSESKDVIDNVEGDSKSAQNSDILVSAVDHNVGDSKPTEDVEMADEENRVEKEGSTPEEGSELDQAMQEEKIEDSEVHSSEYQGEFSKEADVLDAPMDCEEGGSGTQEVAPDVTDGDSDKVVYDEEIEPGSDVEHEKEHEITVAEKAKAEESSASSAADIVQELSSEELCSKSSADDTTEDKPIIGSAISPKGIGEAAEDGSSSDKMEDDEPEKPVDESTTGEPFELMTAQISQSDTSNLQAPDSECDDTQTRESEGLYFRVPESDSAQLLESENSNSRFPESENSNSQFPESENGNSQLQESDNGDSRYPGSENGDSRIPESENANSQFPESESSNLQFPEKDGDDIQNTKSEAGNTRDSFADQMAKESKDNMIEQFLKSGKPPMKIFDECSMESFTSAKSSEYDYGDSFQGSPLPVKRVRELIDESPRASPVPNKRSRASSPGSHDTDACNRSDDDLGQFPAENVFEYQWPLDNPGEWYFVQEQITEFLGIKSFKRKYPDLERRVMDIKEKEFLRERGVVTEEQVTLGLTALRGDEVYDLMMKDYPGRYAEYARVIQEKQRQTISNQHTGYKAPTVDASKIKEYIKKAARQAAEFNALLMREKREERQYYFDLQTMQLHMPQAKMKKLSREDTKIGSYPVAVIPGQYQDYCRSYAPDELRYLPLNTAIYGPMAIRRKTDYAPAVDDQENEDDLDSLSDLDDMLGGKDKPSSNPGATTSNHQQSLQQKQQQQQQQQHYQQQQQQQMQLLQQQQQQQHQQQQQLQKQQELQKREAPVHQHSSGHVTGGGVVRAGPIVVPPGPASSGSDSDIVRLPGPEALQLSMEAVVPAAQPYQPKVKPNAICGLCIKDRHSNPKGVPEELVHCSQCDNSGHPSCLEMNDELVATIKTYPWQCMECKTCSQCGDPTHEDKMMFCDKCDRGYHTFCVGLTDIPTGTWLCPGCTSEGGIPPPGTPSIPTLPLNGVPTPHIPGAAPLMQQPPVPLPPLPPQQQALLAHLQGQPQGLPPSQQHGMPPPPQALPQQQQPPLPPQEQLPPTLAESPVVEATLGTKRKSSKR